MPRLPGEIHRRIQEKTEQKKVGEEGTLHKITLDDESYFAKKWRSKHYKENWKNGLAYSEANAWKTPVSPFWHKIISYETKLIHDALPDITLRIETSYDPRVSKDGSSFNFQAGRPVTLTENVKGDPELRIQRDTIVDSLYDQTWEQRTYDDHDLYTGTKDILHQKILWSNTDIAIQKLFGESLGVRGFIHTNLSTQESSRIWFLNKIHERYPGTDIERLVLAGIIPVHAEVNYIPTEHHPTQTTKGIFIETAIFDEQRLTQALLEAAKKKNPEHFDEEKSRTNIQKRLERYRVLRKIDELWDQIYYQQKYRRGEQEEQFWDNRFGEALFKALDTIRDRYDREGLFFDDSFEHQTQMKWSELIYPTTIEEGIETCKQFETFVRTYQKKEQMAA
ncbi:hypothetical protein HYV70_00670 [Candidatus Uhrbacteria bacterium]|nr:hypothetical protein [Candidatus Uhrbacteria bacterium]